MRKYITEISEKDFRKLNLVGYKMIKVPIGENTHRLGWEKVKLNDVLDYEKKGFNKYFKKCPKCIVVVIHSDQEKAIEYEKLWKKEENASGYYVQGDLPEGFYFWDRFGSYTYLFSDGIDKLYTKEYKWFDKNKEFVIDKRDVDAVYLIHLEED